MGYTMTSLVPTHFSHGSSLNQNFVMPQNFVASAHVATCNWMIYTARMEMKRRERD